MKHTTDNNRWFSGSRTCAISWLMVISLLPIGLPGRSRLPDARDVPGLTSNEVRTLVWEGKKLYVGTWGGGLCIYDASERTWQHMGRSDGLLSDRVTAICMARGELWVGTDRGLCYFDGEKRQWQYFGEHSVLGHDWVTALLWDGRFVWVGTKRGLSRYDTRHRFWATSLREHGLPSDSITCLACRRSLWGRKEVFIGTKGGVLAYDLKLSDAAFDLREKTSQTWAVARRWGGTGTLHYQTGPLDNEVRDIVIQDDVIWIVSRLGITFFDRKAMDRVFPPPWYSYVYDKRYRTWMSLGAYEIQHRNYSEDKSQESYIRCAVPLGDDVCLIANDQVYRCRIAFEARDMAWTGQVPIETTDEPLWVHGACRDKSGTIWIGTDQGIWMYSEQDMVRPAFRAVADGVTEVAGDTLGIVGLSGLGQSIWAVRSNYEVMHYSKGDQEPTVGGRLPALSGDTALSVFLLGDIPYILTESGRCFRWVSGSWQTSRIYGGPPRRFDLGNLMGDEEDAWFASGPELRRLAKGASEASLYQFPQSVSGLCKVGQQVWATGTDVLYRYDRTKDTFSTIALDIGHRRITGVIAHGEILWIGTSSGLIVYHTGTGAQKRICVASHPADLLDDYIYQLHLVGDHLWIVSELGVSCRDLEKHTTDHFLFEIDTPETDLYEVVEDGHYTYFAGSVGLLRYASTTHRWSLFPVDRSRGRLALENIVLDDEYIWGATPKGLYRFDKAAEWWVKQ